MYSNFIDINYILVLIFMIIIDTNYFDITISDKNIVSKRTHILIIYNNTLKRLRLLNAIYRAFDE